MCFLWIDWNSNLLVGICWNWFQFWSNKNDKTSNGCCEFRMLVQSPSKKSWWNVLLESHKKNNPVVYLTWDSFFLSSLHGGGGRSVIAQYNSCQMWKLLTTSSSSLNTLKILLSKMTSPFLSSIEELNIEVHVQVHVRVYICTYDQAKNDTFCGMTETTCYTNIWCCKRLRGRKREMPFRSWHWGHCAI